MGRRSRSRNRSTSRRKGSRSKSKWVDSDSEQEHEPSKLVTMIEYDPRSGQTIDQQIISGKIPLPAKLATIPEPPNPRPVNRDTLRDILSRKRTVLKERHDSITFAAKKDTPEALVQFCHRRVCTATLGIAVVKAAIHKLVRNQLLKLETEKRSNELLRNLNDQLDDFTVEGHELQTFSDVGQLVPRRTLSELEAIQLLTSGQPPAQLARAGVPLALIPGY
jgi:hypothetical protein